MPLLFAYSIRFGVVWTGQETHVGTILRLDEGVKTDLMASIQRTLAITSSATAGAQPTTPGTACVLKQHYSPKLAD